MKLVELEISAAAVTVLVGLLDAADGTDCSVGVTVMYVDTVVRDAPLDGETPLTQLVDP